MFNSYIRLRVIKYSMALLNRKQGINPFKLPKDDIPNLQTRFRDLFTLKATDAFKFDMNFNATMEAEKFYLFCSLYRMEIEFDRKAHAARQVSVVV